ncbi:MAG: dTMP kinase [Thiolinea sp.]
MSASGGCGCFITLEGGEGAGKTTHLQTLMDCLQAQGIAAIATREPGGTLAGEQIRRVLLDPELPAMHADTELLLMFAARNEHLQQRILPALAQGTWVVCDRFTDATYAYQGYGRGLALERITALETWVQGETRPDHTVLLDIDVATGMQRVQQRSADAGIVQDRFEREQGDFYERIRQGYRQQAARYPERFHVVNAAQDMATVQAELQTIMTQIIRQAQGEDCA